MVLILDEGYGWTRAAWLNSQGKKAERQDKNTPKNLFERQPTRSGKKCAQNQWKRASETRAAASEQNQQKWAKLGIPPSACHHVPSERKQRACTPMQKHDDKQNKLRPLVLEPATSRLGTSFRDQSISVCFMLRVHPTPHLIWANMEKLPLINYSLVC